MKKLEAPTMEHILEKMGSTGRTIASRQVPRASTSDHPPTIRAPVTVAPATATPRTASNHPREKQSAHSHSRTPWVATPQSVLDVSTATQSVTHQQHLGTSPVEFPLDPLSWYQIKTGARPGNRMLQKHRRLTPTLRCNTRKPSSIPQYRT